MCGRWHLQHSPGRGRSAYLLVVIGATKDGKKGLLAVMDGFAGEQSWTESAICSRGLAKAQTNSAMPRRARWPSGLEGALLGVRQPTS
jgi:hypothetical protein